MTIRFLQTTPSELQDFPFQAGQVITVETPSRFLLSLLDGVRAEAVPDTEPDLAVARAPRQPKARARA